MAKITVRAVVRNRLTGATICPRVPAHGWRDEAFATGARRWGVCWDSIAIDAAVTCDGRPLHNINPR